MGLDRGQGRAAIDVGVGRAVGGLIEGLRERYPFLSSLLYRVGRSALIVVRMCRSLASKPMARGLHTRYRPAMQRYQVIGWHHVAHNACILS